LEAYTDKKVDIERMKGASSFPFRRLTLTILVLQLSVCKAFRVPYPCTTSHRYTSVNLLHKSSGSRAETRGLEKRSLPILYVHPTVGASIALVGSSFVGMQISTWIPSAGILGTLVTAALAGNIFSRWIPTTHVLYDKCFTLFLPGSLALLLLAYQPPALTQRNWDGADTDISMNKTSEESVTSCIRRVATPFVFASLSSLMGCWLSYRLAILFQWFGANVERARTAAACLSASYVGGSVNCMATARLVGIQADLLGSLVTADLFTMAVYFSFLSSSLDWPWLRAKFRPSTQEKFGSVAGITSLKMRLTMPTTTDCEGDLTIQHNNLKTTSRSKALASIPLLLGTLVIVQLANRVEDVLGPSLPGTACAVLSVVAPLLNSKVHQQGWWRPFSAAATMWSDFFFLSFFASIGIAANLSSALSMGPACLLFSANALTVHVLVTVVGCLLWKRLVHPKASSMELEDVWIASNAAIGGPATAAAFCSRMKQDPGKLQGRTIAATVWGVVGYAIGTILGVGMYRIVGG
jgi:hypothetical protein